MKTDRWPKVKQLLDTVLDLAPEQRATYLDRSCAGDDALRREIECYLRSEAEVRGFMEKPVVDLIGDARHPAEKKVRCNENPEASVAQTDCGSWSRR